MNADQHLSKPKQMHDLAERNQHMEDLMTRTLHILVTVCIAAYVRTYDEIESTRPISLRKPGDICQGADGIRRTGDREAIEWYAKKSTFTFIPTDVKDGG